MSTIRVHRPVATAPSSTPTVLAHRGELRDDAVLTIIDNGKSKGAELMGFIADRLRDLLPIGAVEVHHKPSAGAPITEDVATMLAVRSRLVISGLGD